MLLPFHFAVLKSQSRPALPTLRCTFSLLIQSEALCQGPLLCLNILFELQASVLPAESCLALLSPVRQSSLLSVHRLIRCYFLTERASSPDSRAPFKRFGARHLQLASITRPLKHCSAVSSTSTGQGTCAVSRAAAPPLVYGARCVILEPLVGRLLHPSLSTALQILSVPSADPLVHDVDDHLPDLL